MFPIYHVIFFIFAAILVGSASMVIISRNPVRAALFLVLSFVASSVLWMMLQAEFLSLVLIFVYVGAVMTLFLFVVMMLNVDLSAMQEKFVRYLPLALLVMILFVGMMLLVLGPKHLAAASLLPTHQPADYSNVKQIGSILYTHYLLPFELAAAILLVAIVAAISLAFHGRKPNTKGQKISEQHLVTKDERLRVIKMKAEKKS